MTKSILIDEKTLQVFAHFEEFYFNAFGQQKVPNPAYKNRLSKFFEIIKENHSEEELVVGPITRENLGDALCLVILTRIHAFSEDELRATVDFLQNPEHSLLLMSNHNPFEMHDNELTSKLGISLTGGYYSGERGVYTEISEDCMTHHPIIEGEESEKPISKILTNTTCRIESKLGTPFIYLPDTMVGRWSSEGESPLRNRIFGLAIDGQKEPNEIIKGKVIVLGDSGFLGDKDSTFPGFGMIDRGDNEIFIQRMFRYLLD
ncbi:MAG: hypothetical protein ACFFE2_05410 [Candidatus Thorarchaeota archaeon]